MNTLSLLPALRVPLLAAAALLACSFTAGAQNELIPPGSAPAPAPASAIQPARPAAPAVNEVSAADLQALYSRNAELLAIQKKTLERLAVLEETARQIRIRAARN